LRPGRRLGDRLAEYLTSDRIAEMDTLDAEDEAAAEAAACDVLIVDDEPFALSCGGDVPPESHEWDAPVDPTDVPAFTLA
jgi:hypothetical protein